MCVCTKQDCMTTISVVVFLSPYTYKPLRRTLFGIRDERRYSNYIIRGTRQNNNLSNYSLNLYMPGQLTANYRLIKKKSKLVIIFNNYTCSALIYSSSLFTFDRSHGDPARTQKTYSLRTKTALAARTRILANRQQKKSV